MGAERPGGAAATGAGGRGVFLLGIALLLGIVLLQNFDSGNPPFAEQVRTGQTTSTTIEEEPADPVGPTPTTRPVRPPADVRVLAANGTTTSGLAGRTTDILGQQGYNALAPLDATRVVEASQVQYKADFEAEARALAQFLVLPNSSLRVMEDTPPVPETRDADIIVVIGADLRLPDATSAPTSSSTSTTVR